MQPSEPARTSAQNINSARTPLAWDNIDTVLLDMDGTLLDLHFDNHFWLTHLPKRLAQISQRQPADVEAFLYQQYQNLKGTLNWYCLDYWSDTLQVDIVSLKHEITERIAYRPMVKPFLQRLQQLGKQVLIVTNAHRDSFNLKHEHTQIGDWVNGVISSHDYKTPKEQQAFWQQLQQAHPFDPQTSLLIDDSLAVLRSAKTFGIHHLRGVYQPDSQQAGNMLDEFICLHCFADLFEQPLTEQ